MCCRHLGRCQHYEALPIDRYCAVQAVATLATVLLAFSTCTLYILQNSLSLVVYNMEIVPYLLIVIICSQVNLKLLGARYFYRASLRKALYAVG